MGDRHIDNIREEIWRVLYHSEKPVMSAKDVTNEIGDVSRQYVNRQLNSMADTEGYVERVELGPSVGYYWDSHPIDDLGQQLRGRSLTRASVGSPVIDPCGGCGDTLATGEDVIVLYERAGHEWNRFDVGCMDCFEDVREDELIQTFLDDQYLSEALADVQMALMCVQGTLEEQSFVDENTKRELSTYGFDDVDVLQVIRSREFDVGPEFSEQL